jgi:preprotein translocase subunit SecA
VDQSDLVYRTEEAKLKAVIADIENKHKLGQPVLVGTTSVAKSELVSSYLTKSGIPHEVLNAKQHDREATIIAEAGRKKAVTVATNMAGRGTDIMLGGNPEFRAAQELERRGIDPVENQIEYEAAWQLALDSAKAAVKSEHEEVVAVGGLYVLGTERHESRRIDNQLRGRSGRQGDPGETRFYLSLQDDLMRLFKGDMVNSFLQRFNVPDDVPIEAKMVTNSIRSAQTQVEAQNFEIRKNVLKYDEVMNSQRKVIYAERSRVLDGENIQTQIMTFMADTIASSGTFTVSINGSTSKYVGDLTINTLTKTGSNAASEVKNIYSGSWQPLSTASLTDMRYMYFSNEGTSSIIIAIALVVAAIRSS